MIENKSSPNFLIGGTSAGGTSFLAATLVQHPQIYLPAEMRPEPHYFYKSWEYEKGLSYYLTRWFPDVPKSCIAIGERSSSYLFGGAAVAERITSSFPKMKLIFILRNPVERTWANYRYTVLQGLEDLSFEDALEYEQERIASQQGIWSEIQPHNYTGRGFYGSQIAQFRKYFSADQILILKSELVSAQTEIELKKIYRFLELTEFDFMPRRPVDHTSVNVISGTLQKQLREYYGERFDKVIEAVRREEDLSVFQNTASDREALSNLRENLKSGKEAMPMSSRTYLQRVFAQDIDLLREFVEFDLDDWN